jgi:hypothetical protein
MEHAETIKTLKRLQWMARIMDSTFRIPFTKFRFGVDAAADAVPFAGNAVMTMASLYLVWKAWELGAPRHLLARMVGNVAVEAGLGAIPVIGIVLDALYMANIRNVEMLAEFLRAQGVAVE